MRDMICHDRSGQVMQFDNLHGHYVPNDNNPEAPMVGPSVPGSGLGYGSPSFSADNENIATITSDAFLPSDGEVSTLSDSISLGSQLPRETQPGLQSPVSTLPSIAPQVSHHNGYNIDKAVSYARQWSMKRHSSYYDFEKIGGDCTNFVSQCLYAGAAVMNSKKDTGWYYNNVNDRAPAWTSAAFLYQFLVNNRTGRGPYGSVIDMSQVRPGDVIQISFDGHRFAHSMLVTKVDPMDVYICTHSYDSHDRAMSTYQYHSHRVIRIDGVRR